VDGIVDRRRPLVESAKALGIDGFDAVFSTTHTDEYFAQLADVMRPLGSIVAIDDPGPLDLALLKQRSLRFAWEFMFTKSLFGYRMETQGTILDRIAALVDEGKLRTTANSVHEGLRADVFRKADACSASWCSGRRHSLLPEAFGFSGLPAGTSTVFSAAGKRTRTASAHAEQLRDSWEGAAGTW
jgi:hypothetical protein